MYCISNKGFTRNCIPVLLETEHSYRITYYFVYLSKRPNYEIAMTYQVEKRESTANNKIHRAFLCYRGNAELKRKKRKGVRFPCVLISNTLFVC